MKNKAAIASVCLAASFVFGSGTTAIAAEASNGPNAGKVGLGYEGIFGGSILQGLSGRYWVNNNVAAEVNFFYGNATVSGINFIANKLDGDLLLGTAKVMFSPVVKPHSRFYVGIEGGLGSINLEADGVGTPGDVGVYVVNPLIGSEFSFAEIPELGFNFEVGYKFHHIDYTNDANVGDIDIDLNGIAIALGAHYYF
ncbi:MAG: hypothetical protein HGB00_07275 [Chlorobiaceae bacterium]|nr:hypothetical protein [Chlorobiaceae bacterium]